MTYVVVTITYVLLFYMNVTIFSDLLYQGADILRSLLYLVFLILHALFCVCDEGRMVRWEDIAAMRNKNCLYA